MTPTLKTLTLKDIAIIGRFFDDYAERFRSTRKGAAYDAYRAAGRLIDGTEKSGDEELVREWYERAVIDCFHRNGKLPRFVRVNTYEKPTPEDCEAAVAAMRERRERALLKKLKEKYETV